MLVLGVALVVLVPGAPATGTPSPGAGASTTTRKPAAGASLACSPPTTTSPTSARTPRVPVGEGSPADAALFSQLADAQGRRDLLNGAIVDLDSQVTFAKSKLKANEDYLHQ